MYEGKKKNPPSGGLQILGLRKNVRKNLDTTGSLRARRWILSSAQVAQFGRVLQLPHRRQILQSGEEEQSTPEPDIQAWSPRDPEIHGEEGEGERRAVRAFFATKPKGGHVGSA